MLSTKSTGRDATIMMKSVYANEPTDGLVSVHLFDETPSCGQPPRVGVWAIWSEKERQKGHASRALKRMCAAADKHRVALILAASMLRYDTDTNSERYSDVEADRLDALNELGLGREQLFAW